MIEALAAQGYPLWCCVVDATDRAAHTGRVIGWINDPRFRPVVAVEDTFGHVDECRPVDLRRDWFLGDSPAEAQERAKSWLNRNPSSGQPFLTIREGRVVEALDG